MLYIILIVVVLVIGVFVWAHYRVEADEAKLIEEDPGALYPFFGIFTERLKYTTSTYAKDVILSDTNTGRIYIGGKIYNMLDIASCRAETLGGHTTTSYHDVQTISTNTGSALGRAIVGGVIGGGVGAIIGASTASREIKTKTVAKNNYIPKFQCLILEFTNASPFVSTVTAKSQSEMDEVVSFINNEIRYYKNKLKEGKMETEKKIAAFIKTPLDYSFDQVKEFDPDVITSLKDSLLLSQNATRKCANGMGLMSLQHVNVGADEVRFSSFSGNFQVVKEDAIKLKAYLVDKFGKPSNDKDIDILSSEDLTKGYHIEWQNKAYYILYHDEKNDHYQCTIKIFRKKEFAIENVQISNEYHQKENDYKVFMEAPLNYPIEQITKLDPKCIVLKSLGSYSFSKEAIKMCSEVSRLQALHMVSVGPKSILFASKSKSFEAVKNDAIFFKNVLNKMFGEAENEQDIKDFDKDVIYNKILLKWGNSSRLFLYFKEEDETINLSVDLQRAVIEKGKSN